MEDLNVPLVYSASVSHSSIESATPNRLNADEEGDGGEWEDITPIRAAAVNKKTEGLANDLSQCDRSKQNEKVFEGNKSLLSMVENLRFELEYSEMTNELDAEAQRGLLEIVSHQALKSPQQRPPNETVSTYIGLKQPNCEHEMMNNLMLASYKDGNNIPANLYQPSVGVKIGSNGAPPIGKEMSSNSTEEDMENHTEDWLSFNDELKGNHVQASPDATKAADGLENTATVIDALEYQLRHVSSNEDRQHVSVACLDEEIGIMKETTEPDNGSFKSLPDLRREGFDEMCSSSEPTDRGILSTAGALFERDGDTREWEQKDIPITLATESPNAHTEYLIDVAEPPVNPKRRRKKRKKKGKKK